MHHGTSRAVLLAAALALGACAAGIDLKRQGELARQELKVEALESMSGCSYATVPYGQLQGNFRSGACFIAKGALYLRVVDATNPELGRYVRFDRDNAESYSLFRGPFGNAQLQVRLRQGVYALSATGSGGLSDNRERTEAYARALQAAGVQEVETKRAIAPPLQPAPVYVYEPPAKRK